MNRYRLISSIAWISIVAMCGTFFSCSDTVCGEGGVLPDGKYPMNFIVGMDGLAVGRAEGKDVWKLDDQITVSLNESSDSKTYKVTDISNGAMEPVTPSDMYYWKTNTEELKILAWYPTASVINVDISDQSHGFADFDFLKAETTARFSANDGIKLSFVHQMAKVTCTLVAGNEITDVSNATVSFYGYTKASFAKGIVDKDESSNGWIISTTDKEVLLVPQEMKGQQFIRVSISGREYFYTPGENEAKLEAGKQYNYTIKVTETGLEVTLIFSPAWKENGTTTGGSEVSSFKVKIPTVADVVPIIIGAAKSSGEIYTTTANSFSITLSTGGGVEAFIVKGGACDVKRTAESGGSYTFTYSNIRSNLEMVYDKYVEVGDYYYADGTWSPDYTSDGAVACIGIIFKLGAASGDMASNYDDKLPNGIHGYVVALTDALTYAGEWGVKGTDENGEYLSNISYNDNTQYNGYTQTKYILDVHSTDLGRYEAFSAIKDYSVTAPTTGNSGWYLPSMRQLSDVWQLYKGTEGNILYNRLSAISQSNLFQTGNDGAHHNKDNNYRYWTSTERSGSLAWGIIFDTSGTIAIIGKDSSYSILGRARAILTF